jgi:hypothetical protein
MNRTVDGGVKQSAKTRRTRKSKGKARTSARTANPEATGTEPSSSLKLIVVDDPDDALRLAAVAGPESVATFNELNDADSDELHRLVYLRNVLVVVPGDAGPSLLARANQAIDRAEPLAEEARGVVWGEWHSTKKLGLSAGLNSLASVWAAFSLLPELDRSNWPPKPSANGDGHHGANGKAAGGGDQSKPPTPERLATTRLNTIQPVPIRWLVPRYIPRGKLVVVAGDGGLGKSTFTIESSARLSRGQTWFGLTYDGPVLADVLLISCEDDYADTVVPRLIAAGADLDRIERVDCIIRDNGKPAPFGLAHYEALEAHLTFNPQIALVVIDPAGAYVGRTGVDDHRNSELTALLGPLAELAARRNATIILVCHINKGVSAKAVHRIMGGVGYVNSARAVFVVGPHPEDEDRRVIVRAKGNCGPRPPGRAFRMVEISEDQKDAIWQSTLLDHLSVDDRTLLLDQMMCLQWEQAAAEFTADDVLGRDGRQSKGPNKIEQAGAWLVKFLGNGPRASEEVFEEGQKAGFTKDNLYKAKQAREIKAKPAGLQGHFRWGLGDPKDWPPVNNDEPFTVEAIGDGLDRRPY